MALQVGLPLNGNLNNQGLDGSLTKTGGTASGYPGGKISSSGLNLSSRVNFKSPAMENKTKGTVAFGAKVDANTSLSSDGVDVCGLTDIKTDGTAGTFRGETCYSSSLSSRGISGHDNGTYATVTSGSDLSPKGKGQGMHCCFTTDSKTAHGYYDGVMKSTLTSAGGHLNGVFYLGENTNINGCIQDLRIYDEALSPREVKELSKGLVLHYPLDNPCETSSANKYSGEYFRGGASGSSYTKTKLANEVGYNYKLNYTGNGNNSGPYLKFPSCTFTAGKTYDYSCKIRVHSANFNIYFRASRMDNDGEASSKKVVSSSLADGKWHEYHTLVTLQATSTRSGTSYTTVPMIEFYADNLSTSGTVYKCDFDVKDIQFCECSTNVYSHDGAGATSNVHDTSGFSYSGTTSGTLSFSNDSPRGRGSIYAANGTDYIKSNLTSTMSELSCSFGIKPSSSNGGYSIVTSNYNNPSSGFGIATNCEGSGLGFFTGAYARMTTALTNGTGYHGCFTFKNGVCKGYLNGELKSTTDISATKTSLPISNLSIGNSYTGTSWNTKQYGNISDFRLYSTELSAADVKELYNAPISITNSGTLMIQGEVVE